MARPKRSRVQIADEIAIGAVLFVEKARAQGCSNTITTLLLLEVAEERGYRGYQYSVGTVKRLARECARRRGMEDLIEFD